jgi:predicted nucleotidyltransferase
MTHTPTAEQAALIAAIHRVLEADPRIAALWLAGSLGRGAGDAWSDVDMLVLCEDGKVAEVSAAYAKDITAIATPVLLKPLFGGVILNVVTQDWQRFDLTLIEAGGLPRYYANELTPLFNRGTRTPQLGDRPPHRTDPAALRATIEEFLRIFGTAPVAYGRGEHIVTLTGVGLLRGLLIELMLEENGLGPAQRGGALHLNTLLTGEQRRALEALPPVTTERESLLAANRALATLFFPRARALAAKIGMVWPQALEDATRAHLKRAMDFEF